MNHFNLYYSLRRPIDVQNNWTRVACDISNQPVNGLLIKRLKATIETLQENLKGENLFIIHGGINISRKTWCSILEAVLSCIEAVLYSNLLGSNDTS